MGRNPSPWYWRARKGWYVTIDGRRHRLGRQKAESIVRFYQLLAGVDVTVDHVTALRVDHLCAEFLGQGTVGLARSTRLWYGRHLDSFVDACGLMPSTTVRPIDVTRWLNGHTWSESTRRGAVTAVKRAFRWAHRQGLLAVDQLAHLEKPPGQRRAVVLTREQ